MITLHIKGDIKQVFASADEHQVELFSIAQICDGRGNCVASTPDRFLPLVIRWFCDGMDVAPFPAGTLLFYTSDSGS